MLPFEANETWKFPFARVKSPWEMMIADGYFEMKGDTVKHDKQLGDSQKYWKSGNPIGQVNHDGV